MACRYGVCKLISTCERLLLFEVFRRSLCTPTHYCKSLYFYYHYYLINFRCFISTKMSLLITSVILSGSFLLTIILQLLMNLQHPILLGKNNNNHHEYKKLERRSYLLEDHPKCGITTGGKEECWWSCTLVNPASPYPRYKVSLKIFLFFL